MKSLKLVDTMFISGGEIIPGTATPEITALNIKLMIAAGRGQPGFDVTSAVTALTRTLPIEFSSDSIALEYVRNGGIPL